ncbi:MAG: glutamine synthetase family protein [Chloroflexota bacterium]
MDQHDVLRKVEEHSIDFIRIEHLDYCGIIRSRAVRRDCLAAALEKGINFSTAMLSFTVYEDLIEHPRYGAAEGDYFAVPDPNTFAVVPYARSTARMFSDLLDHQGRPFEGCLRSILKRIIADAERQGIHFQVACELEGYLLRKEDGRYGPADWSKCFTTDGLDIQEDIIHEVSQTLEQMGISVEKVTAEYGPAQIEMNMHHTDPLRAADDCITYKEAWRAIARKYGYIATFMPKPFAGLAGSGLHLHISATDNDGRNLFEDRADPRGLSLSRFGYQFTGGLLKHARSMAAFSSPTVNSYKRLLPGTWAPAQICYGAGNRSVLVRIPEFTPRVEYRSADGTCNPYLTIATTLASGLDGVAQAMDPGQPMQIDVGHMGETELTELGIGYLPRNLGEAIAATREEGDFWSKVLGEAVVDEFLRVREGEWNRFMAQVTPWETETYIETY